MATSQPQTDSSQTIVTDVLRSMEKDPNREMIVFYAGNKRESFTAQQIVNLAGKMAALLVREGFHKGDVIANTLPNSPERIVTDLGILFAGCIPMNVQIHVADGEDFFQSARRSRCVAVVVCPEGWSPGWKLLQPLVIGSTSGCFTSIKCGLAQEMTKAVLAHSRGDAEKHSSLLSTLEQSDLDPYIDPGRPDDIAYVCTTSGSTGYSKLVPKTHAQFPAAFQASAETLATMKNAIAVSDTPTGSGNQILVQLSVRPFGWAGGHPYRELIGSTRRVCTDNMLQRAELDEASIVKICRDEDVQLLTILPHELDKVARYVEKNGGFTKVRVVDAGGQPLTKAVLQKGLVLAHSLMVIYGGTECSACTLGVLTPGDDVNDFYCGSAVAGSDIRIVNNDNEAVGTGQIGNIQVKTVTRFQGYFNRLEDPDPQDVDAFTSDGYYRTGDYGYVDDKGDYYVMGRSKEVIMHGNCMVYPGWLERRILDHPDIVDCLVLPVSDPAMFHAICACVKVEEGSQLTEEMLEDFCKTLFLTDNDETPMPKFFKILKDLGFPKTETGKLHRGKVRIWMEELFGQK